MATMHCDFCLQLFQDLAKRAIVLSATYRSGEHPPGGSDRWAAEKKTTLRQTQSQCDFCRTVFQLLEDKRLLDVPLDYEMILRENVVQDDLLSSCWIKIRTNRQDLESRYLRFTLWADLDTPASAVLKSRPPLLTTNLDDIGILVQYWLNQCISSHGICSTPDETLLPTRVLEISGDTAVPFIRLVETKAMRGRYCALSHCWGPPEMRPLLSTRENISEHLNQIRLERLPKTFREAVMLAYRIGLSYLWIDSLCIIQNDKQDWHAEAKEMGSVYRNATLVIAAAGSNDSTEGLIFKERPQAIIVAAPYFDNDLVNGSFNLSVMPERMYSFGIELEQANLNTRAWAFQEWYLAQRLLIFTSLGIAWRCEEWVMNEHEIYTDLQLYSRNSWLCLLEEYSGKKLTYSSDRLYALQGIVAEMKKTRQDRYYQQYGVWESQLPDQLLWTKIADCPEGGSLELPTWTWAATEWRKYWVMADVDAKDVDQRMLKWISITGAGSIKALGQMARFKHVLQWNFRRTDFILKEFGILFTYEQRMFPTYFWNGTVRPYLLVADDSSDEFVMGIAIFDSYEEHVQHARCFFMVSALRKHFVKSDVSMDSASSGTNGDLDTSESDSVSQMVADEILPNFPGAGSFSMEVDSDDRGTGERSADADEGPHHATSKSGSSERSRHLYSPIHKSCRSSVEDKAINADNEEGKQKAEEYDNDDDGDDEDDDEDDDNDEEEDDEDDEDEEDDEDDWHRAQEVARLALTTSHVYWALLLDPIGEGKYKRVGVAMIYPHAFETSSKDLVEVEIV